MCTLWPRREGKGTQRVAEEHVISPSVACWLCVRVCHLSSKLRWMVSAYYKRAMVPTEIWRLPEPVTAAATWTQPREPQETREFTWPVKADSSPPLSQSFKTILRRRLPITRHPSPIEEVRWDPIRSGSGLELHHHSTHFTLSRLGKSGGVPSLISFSPRFRKQTRPNGVHFVVKLEQPHPIPGTKPHQREAPE